MALDPLTDSQIVRFGRIAKWVAWFKANVLPASVLAIASVIVGGLAGHFEAYIGFGYRLSALETSQTAMKATVDSTLGAGSQLKSDVAVLQEQVAAISRRLDRYDSNFDLTYNEKIRAQRQRK